LKDLIWIKALRRLNWPSLAQRFHPRLSMRAPTERDQCQANLDRMVNAFMYNDWPRYREAVAFLRDYVDQKQSSQGKMRRGRNWYMPKQVEAMREHARSISVPRITSDIRR
jgi:predicted deacetylase